MAGTRTARKRFTAVSSCRRSRAAAAATDATTPTRVGAAASPSVVGHWHVAAVYAGVQLRGVRSVAGAVRDDGLEACLRDLVDLEEIEVAELDVPVPNAPVRVVRRLRRVLLHVEIGLGYSG